MTHPILICPTHGDQGARIVCKWCSFDLFQSIGVNRRDSSSLPGVSECVESTPFSSDLLQDQYQAAGDGF
jgi:hypothetical protein